MYTRETEIRLISSADIFKLAQILDPNNSWKKLMQIIPKDFHSKSPEDMAYKYNYDHVRLVENASIKQNRMATEILLDEWGTSGKKRPTVGVLLELLVRAELFRAADMVALNYLNEPPPARPLKGPAAKIDISIPLDSEFINNVESMLNDGDSNFPGTETLNDNAKANLADNNIDYFEKYHPNQKRIEVPPPSNDLNNFSRTPTDNGIKTPESSSEAPQPSQREQSHSSQNASHSEQNQSHLQQNALPSDLMKFSSTSITDTQAIPVLSELLPHTAASDTNISEISVSQSMDIPMLSAFNTQQSVEDMIPNLSALNVEEVELDDDKLKPPEEAASMLSSSSVSSLSSVAEDELSAPNLSILDQRSSNNDSSLTNVTGTSEENSFEMSINEGSASNDNIPCLSALK